jgi:quercetin dioxygenase-like cupin family protein
MPAIPTRSEAMRRTETPNAVMTTVASPTQSSTDEISVWKVHMHAGQQGPRHVFDREQVWHLLGGEIEIAAEDESMHLWPGDAVVLAADTERQITALVDADVIVCGRSDAIVFVPGEKESRGRPPWVS